MMERDPLTIDEVESCTRQLRGLVTAITVHAGDGDTRRRLDEVLGRLDELLLLCDFARAEYDGIVVRVADE